MRRIVAAVGLLLSVAGCSSTSTTPAHAPTPTPTSTLSTATRTQAGVAVRVSVMGQGSAGWRLKVLLVPLSRGFHLYSLSLPNGGEQGLGIPTRLSVRGALEATGAATAQEPTRLLDIAVLGVKLPVYPDGPVTLDLPVRDAAAAASGDGAVAQVVVSYGACSSATCLAPVIGEVIPVSVP